MKKIDYPYPVTSWDVYNFVDVFASFYMFLEKMSSEKVEYYCYKHEKGDCYGCKHGYCKELGFSPAKIHEILVFTFGTFSGFTSAVSAFGRQSEVNKRIVDTDDTIEFLFGYTGYAYEKRADILTAAAESVNAEIPAVARLKNVNSKKFRLITGYDGENLIAIQKSGEKFYTADDIEAVYVVTGKTERKYTFTDALARIKYVMECNNEERVWDEYIEKFKFWGKRENESIQDMKVRFEKLRRLTDTFYCHSFAEPFRHRILAEIKDERLNAYCKTIDKAYDDSHTVGWQCQALYYCRDWTKRHDDSTEGGYFAIAQDAARRLKKNEETVYSAVCDMIQILSYEKERK